MIVPPVESENALILKSENPSVSGWFRAQRTRTYRPGYRGAFSFAGGQGMTTYRITDWDTKFENNRSRELKRADWFPCPNSYDGDGYCAMIDGPDGPIAYCGWILLCGVASRCKPRGILMQTTGKPHTAETIAAKTRVPVRVIEIAITRALAEGWIIPHEGAVISHPPATIPHPPAVPSVPFHSVPIHVRVSEDSPESGEVFSAIESWLGRKLNAVHDETRRVSTGMQSWSQDKPTENGKPVPWSVAVCRCIKALQASGTVCKSVPFAVSCISGRMADFNRGVVPEPPSLSGGHSGGALADLPTPDFAAQAVRSAQRKKEMAELGIDYTGRKIK